MPAIDRAYEQELFRSCRILFGAEVDIGRDFLFCLQTAGIKSAFRRRAFLTHPDLAGRRGGAAASESTRVFIEARQAYESLLDFIRRKNTCGVPGNRTARTQPAGRGPRRDARRKPGGEGRPEYFYRGKLPARTLLLGEFLFYAGAVSWEALIRAIVWQRRQRPRLGEMASRRGWVGRGKARAVALEKGPGTPMGKALVDCGLLNRGQVRFLLRNQRHLQKNLGEYFVSRGHLSPGRLGSLLLARSRHNAACAARPAR